MIRVDADASLRVSGLLRGLEREARSAQRRFERGGHPDDIIDQMADVIAAATRVTDEMRTALAQRPSATSPDPTRP